jgi:hypothetical protein
LLTDLGDVRLSFLKLACCPACEGSLTVLSAARVLKPGVFSLPSTSQSWGEGRRKDVLEQDTAQELEFGILESRARLHHYWRPMERAGFEDIEVTPLQTFP